MERTSSNIYPFVKCLNPRVIRNKWTHEKIMVSCGKCEACLSRKSSMNTMKCRLEFSRHSYTKFVTLTYDEENVPRMIPVRYYHTSKNTSCLQDYFSPYRYVEEKPRLNGKTCEFLSPFENKDSHAILSTKVNHKYIPYLCKRDLQLFVKRLRRYYERLSNKFNIPFGPIRFYACGEYGPVHFRPHYHLIIGYSCEEVNTTIGEAISACWKFGRVATETPREDVSKYVAKYVNGNSYLPEILKSPKIRPFSTHSQHLGEEIFKERREKIYESPTEEVVRKSLFVANSYTDVYMWRSLKTYYFPRCKAYDLCTPQFRLYSYTLKSRSDEIFGRKNTSEQSRLILSYLHYMTRFKIQLSGQWHPDPNINDFYHYFIKMCAVDPYQLEMAEYYESAFRSVYMVLRLSNHFIRFCCDGNLSRAKYMVDKIDKFYKDCDYLNLRNQYVDLEEFAKDWFEDEEEYKLCFQLYPDAITNTKVFKRFRARTINNFNASMKHKKQNDLNRVFENLK